MSDRASVLVVAALLVACRPDAPTKSDPYERAGDAAYKYVAALASGEGASPFDASARPTIAHIAGYAGSRGDLDGTGSSARIGLAVGMARVADAIVFADEGNGSVRRFVPATSEVETLARLPLPGGDVPALPAYVAYDGTHTLYVTDRASHVLYALDLGTRALSVIVGHRGVRGERDGALEAAELDTPTGIAFDGSHTLFVGDVANHHIRRVDLSARTVATLGGSFSQVWGLCSSANHLYATDVLREALYEVDAANGATTLLAGSDRFGYAGAVDGLVGNARLHSPRGMACGPNGVFVAERWNGAIRHWDASTKKLVTIAGTPATLGWRDGAARHALFADIQSVLAWDDATLYAGDEGAIRKVALDTEQVTTVAGTPSRTINLSHLEDNAIGGPTGVAYVASERAAFVVSCQTTMIQRVDITTGTTRTFAGDPIVHGFVDDYGSAARFGCLAAVTSDLRGNLFVGDRDNHAVRGVVVAGAKVMTLGGTPSKCGSDDGPFESASFCDPSGLAYGHDAVYVADAATSTIRRINLAARTVQTIAGAPFERGKVDGTGTVARFAAPVSLAFRGGLLYVADRDNDALRVVDTNSGAVSTLGVHVERPRAVSFVDDELLVADRRAVQRVSIATNASVRIVGVGGGLRLGAITPLFHEPIAITPLGVGDALVVDGTENALERLVY